MKTTHNPRLQKKNHKFKFPKIQELNKNQTIPDHKRLHIYHQFFWNCSTHQPSLPSRPTTIFGVSVIKTKEPDSKQGGKCRFYLGFNWITECSLQIVETQIKPSNQRRNHSENLAGKRPGK